MLISQEYKALQVQKHIDKPNWGQAAVVNASNIAAFCSEYNIKSMLDYGCGKQRLRDVMAPLGVEVTGYDPGIDGLDTPPEPHDYVVCIDVLEHIEPDCIDAVLDDLRRVTKVKGFYIIACTPAGTFLADGRNAHLIVEPPEWWMERLKKRFTVEVFGASETSFGVIVG